LERIFDGIAVVAYLAVGLMFLEGLDPSIQRYAYVVALAGALAVGAGLVYVIWTKPFVAGSAERSANRKPRFRCAPTASPAPISLPTPSPPAGA
jgi:hypothetical protein